MAWTSEIYTINVGAGDASVITLEHSEQLKNDFNECMQKEIIELQIRSYKIYNYHNDIKLRFKSILLKYQKKSYKSILIDGGAGNFSVRKDNLSQRKKNSENILQLLMTKEQLLSDILITHADLDHYQGIIDLIGLININAYFKTLIHCLTTFVLQKEKLKIEEDKEKLKKILLNYIYVNLIKEPENDGNKIHNDDIFIYSHYEDIIYITDNYKFSEQDTEEAKKKFDIEKIYTLFNQFKDKSDIIQLLKEEWQKKPSQFDIFKKQSEITTNWGEKELFILNENSSDNGYFKFNMSEINLWTSERNENIGFGKRPNLETAINGLGSYRRLKFKKIVLGNKKEKNSFLGSNIFNGEDNKLNIESLMPDSGAGLYILGYDKEIYRFNEDIKEKFENEEKKYAENFEVNLGSTEQNLSSIALLLVNGKQTYLTCGDLEDEEQDNVDNYNPARKNHESKLANILSFAGYTNLTLMKLGHHGGSHASSFYVLNKLKPNNVIISCGSSHGHPKVKVLARLYSLDNVPGIFLTNCIPRYGVKSSWKNNELVSKDSKAFFHGDSAAKIYNKYKKSNDQVPIFEYKNKEFKLNGNYTADKATVLNNDFYKVDDFKTFEVNTGTYTFTLENLKSSAKCSIEESEGDDEIEGEIEVKNMLRKMNLRKRAPERNNDLIEDKLLLISNDFLQRLMEIISGVGSIEQFVNVVGNEAFLIYNEEKWIWRLPGFDHFNLLVYDFYAEKKESIDETCNFYIEGRAKAFIIVNDKLTTIAVVLTLNNKNLYPFWNIELLDSAIETISIDSIFKAANDNFTPFYIPEELDSVYNNESKVIIKKLSGSIHAGTIQTSSVNLSIEQNESWELISEKLVVENIGFKVSLSPDSISASLYGTFKIKEKEVVLNVAMDDETLWYMSAYGKQQDDGSYAALPSIMDIGYWFFDDFKMPEISFINSKDGNYNFNITCIQLQLDFASEKNKIKKLAVNTRIKIELLTFNILLQVMPYWYIKGYLDTNSTTTLSEIFNSFGLESVSSSIDNIRITKAQLEASPSYNLYSIAIAIGNICNFNIGSTKFLLEEVFLEIKSVNGSINGYLNAELLVKQTEHPKKDCNSYYEHSAIFKLSAQHEGKIWFFEGNLTGDITLKELTDWLASKFKIENLPPWIENMHLKNASIAFSAVGDYSFNLELCSYLNNDNNDESQKIDIQFYINKIAGEAFKFSASVEIGGHLFMALMEKNSQHTKLKFEWQDQKNDDEITVSDILYDLGLQDTLQWPDSLDIGFNRAAIEFETDEAAKSLTFSAGKKEKFNFKLTAAKWKGSWMYAFSLTIEKISLHFNSLSLIGSELPENIGINNILLLALSQDVDANEDRYPAFIPESIQPTGKEATLQKGGYLHMVLDLGLDNKYPVKISTNGRKKQKSKKEDDENAVVILHAGEKGGDEDQPAVTWKKIGKKIGPLQLNKIGFAFQDSELNLYFDAAVLVGPLMLGMDELQLTSPITAFHPKASLNGLSLKYSSEAVQIGGSFRREGEDRYSGSALIGTKAFQLKAIGAYAKEGGESSLFVYAILNKDLGGPSQFYLKGIAAGYGYNRNLMLPSLDTVQHYPFVAPFIDQAGKSGAKLDENTTISQASEILSNYVKPMSGQQWFVAGVRFSTYNILDSVALLALKLGTKTEVALIGFSEINYPKKSDKPLIHAQLALLANIFPEDGIATVNAQLTDESYLFSKDCRLTGAFAFYLWFGNNANSGDFVVTLGGYHPNFKVPGHYPQVPRLKFNWPVTSELSIKGEMYFALTPGCIMAGGRFDANYHSGNFRAWFTMGADFMIAWKPYHYEANMYVVFGVNYQFRLNLLFKTITKTISANFGAQLQVWGPDFSGKALIDLSVVSFTMNFGNARKGDRHIIDWDEFKTSFLPENKTVEYFESSADMFFTATYCSSKAISGVKVETLQNVVQLGHENVVFEISTVIPSKKTNALNHSEWEKNIGIKPAGLSSDKFTSELNIEVIKDGEIRDLEHNFMVREKLENVAGAMWSDGAEQHLVNNALMGLYLEPKLKNNGAVVVFSTDAKKREPVGVKITSCVEAVNRINIDREMAEIFSGRGWI